MEIGITIHELGLRGCLFFAVVLFFNIFFGQTKSTYLKKELRYGNQWVF